MCLNILHTAKHEIADTDIVCYKILEREGSGDEQTLSPIFQKYKPNGGKNIYKLGEVNPKVEIKPMQDIYDYYNKIIERGYHSFCEPPTNCVGVRPHEVVVKCIIPKGTKFYLGRDSNSVLGFASEQIIVDSIIKDFTNEAIIRLKSLQVTIT